MQNSLVSCYSVCLKAKNSKCMAYENQTRFNIEETFLSQKVPGQGALRCEIKITHPLLISVKGNVP